MEQEEMLTYQVMNTIERKTCENDDIENSDESDRPSGERWAPVGANDGDNDFGDEYKYVDSIGNLSNDMERLKILEEEQEMLNSSLIALTTHFAQVQFRLRQIVDAPTNEKESLLKELEEFAFRGIPDVPNNLLFESRSITPISPTSCKENQIGSMVSDIDVESKMALQRTKQRELISQLKSQLEDLEKYAYEMGDADLPQSVVLERQSIIINHLKEKLNFNVDDLCKLPVDDLRWQVDYAISQIVSPLKMKEQLVSQLKTQIADLERFINYLQGEVSTETLACTCACPVHTNGSAAFNHTKKFGKKAIDNESKTKTLNTVKKVVALLHMFIISQLGCGSERVRRNLNKNSIYNWRDLRTRLDIAVEHVLSTIIENEHQLEDEDVGADEYTSDSDSASTHCNAKLTSAIRKHLAASIRDLLQHGLMSDVRSNSVVPFMGCFHQRSPSSANFMHAWELILKYYEIKNGHYYNSSPAQKLSQSFNLDLVGKATSAKQSLLTTIGNIIASHSPYKRSRDSHFKAFICAALNANKLVVWLKLILQCQYLLECHYTSWSYVVKTGFQDAFHTLDKLTRYKFDLPVDLAVRQFQNIKDAF
ncbi:RUN domain-containing protein 1 isoform X1 [Vespula pensylvanica]|uniref:RUN domain-containing protein n=1 Tax=Vespula pensylvanica TaxID=30213 RepID=A0A834UE17_VESPE|nr:RUN domain-containing protein 1 isoform X1 [Vespula pensylvanica]KAF7434092.1 hypothetical protein H0235_002283 [Vespula pensylvanica]